MHGKAGSTGLVEAFSAIDLFAGVVDEVSIEFVDEVDADSERDSYRKFKSSWPIMLVSCYS
jgi:hypothetical protein